MTLELAVDFSQWGGELDQQTIYCWRQYDIKKAIVQYSEVMPQHLQALHRFGNDFKIEAYVYLYWNRVESAAQRTQNAILMARANGGIEFLWLDAEDSEGVYTDDKLLECVAVCEANNMPCGIYTAKWWWSDKAKNSTRFSHLPLWDAFYISSSGLANLPTDINQGFNPYGGWTKRTVWQWHNTTSLCDHTVDINSYEAVEVIPEVEDEMIRHNKIAEWFDGKVLPDSSGAFFVMQAQTDFDLPEEANEVMFSVWLDAGEIAWFDGNSNSEAGRVGARGVNYMIIRAKLAPKRDGSEDRGKTLNFQTIGNCSIGRVMCLGYFK